jgi:hypothetical protein
MQRTQNAYIDLITAIKAHATKAQILFHNYDYAIPT